MIIEKHFTGRLIDADNNYDFFTYSAVLADDLYPLPVISGSEVVWGHSIIRDASAKNIEEIYCRNISGTAESNLLTALAAENRKDSYSWYEKEKILTFIRKNSLDEENTHILSLIQSEGSFIPNTDRFTKLDSVLKEIVNNNIIDLKTAGRIKDLEDGIILKAVDIIKDFSFSRKRLFMNYLVEMTKKGNRSMDEIISMLDSAAVSESPFDYISLQRYPALKKLEEDFSTYTERNLKGSGIQLKSPPYFEGGSYSVQFSFKSEKQLGRIIERLEKVRETSDEIFRLL